jgi:hypothetical protein
MTQLFAHFSGPDAIAHVPGAAFFASAILAAFCFAIYWIAARDRPAAADAAPVAPPVVPAP